MKTIKSCLAALLACALLFSLASCGGGDTSKEPGGNGAGSAEAFTTEAGTQMPAFSTEKSTLTILGDVSWQYKEGGYIYEFFKKYYNCTIKVLSASADNVYTELVARINAGTDIPDLVISHYGFPTLPSMGYIQPVDSLGLDYSLPFMKSTAPVYSQYIYGGSHYYLPINAYGYENVYYNSKVMEDNGLKTPKDLFMAGEWTMDKLYEYAKLLNQDKNGDGEAERWGLAMPTYHAARLAYSTGETLTNIKDKTVEPNLKSTAIQKQMERIHSAIYADKIAPVNGEIDYNCQLLNNGQAAMCIGPMFWKEEDYFPNLLESQTLEWAPMPKAEGTDAHYVAGESNGFYMPSGSNCPNLVKAFIYSSCAAWYEQLKETSQWHQYDAATYLEKYGKYGYTQEDYLADNEYDNYVAEKVTIICDPLQEIIEPGEISEYLNDGKSYQQMLSELTPVLNTRIQDLYDVDYED